jgi:hypothetical protein
MSGGDRCTHCISRAQQRPDWKHGRINNVGTSVTLPHHAAFAGRESAMKVMVKKWGNCASVRIPGAVMAAAALSLDQAVGSRPNEENRHGPIDTGAPRGREFW